MNKLFPFLFFASFFFSCDLLSGNNQSKEKSQIESNQPTDFDGHIYSTVKIGNQIWIAENLQTTHFLNGDEIYEAKTMSDWFNCFLNKQPCLKKIGKSILYNGYVVQDKRGLVNGNFTIPALNDFILLRKKLGKSAHQKLATYEWEDLPDDNQNAGEVTVYKKGNNKSGFNAQENSCIYAAFSDENLDDQKGKVIELSNPIPAWYWTKTKGNCIDCLGYKGNCLETVMIGTLLSFVCDDPKEGPANYAYGLPIRLVSNENNYLNNDTKKKSPDEKNIIIGNYLESNGEEYFEKLDGVEGLAHWIDGEIIFTVNGKKVQFYVHQDTERDFEANNIKAFWSKNPIILEKGAHGAVYNFTNTSNVGKKYKLHFKKDSQNKLIIKDYQLWNE